MALRKRSFIVEIKEGAKYILKRGLFHRPHPVKVSKVYDGLVYYTVPQGEDTKIGMFIMDIKNFQKNIYICQKLSQ